MANIMKKKSILILTLSLVLLLSACGGNTESNVVLPEVDDFSIENVFEDKFGNSEEYVYEVVYEDGPVIYEVYNPNLEKTSVTYTLNEDDYMKLATKEFDPFDLFALYNGELKGLVELLEYNYINFSNVAKFMEQYKISYVPPVIENPYFDEQNMIKDKVATALYYGRLDEEGRWLIPSTVVSYYELGNYDYDWVMLYSNEKSNSFEDLFVAKYSTQEQKDAIMKAIKDRNAQSHWEEGFGAKLTLELDDNIIVSYININAPLRQEEFIERLFTESNFNDKDFMTVPEPMDNNADEPLEQPQMPEEMEQPSEGDVPTEPSLEDIIKDLEFVYNDTEE